VDGKRRCKTKTLSRRLAVKRVSGGYRATAKLKLTRYKLSALAKDQAGNRSKSLTKRFRVKKR
jgi:hypothetical protein